MFTHRQRVIRGTVTSEHVVQLFDLVDTLATGVASFLAQGLAQDANVLLVARPQHVDAVHRELTNAGFAPDALIADGTLTVLDARTTLRRFIRAGMPDAALFEASVADTVRRLAAASDGQLHVYGEMVDLLAEEGSFAAVEALEGLWSELATTASFSLLCGYSSSHFVVPPKGTDRLRAICHHHMRVHRSNEDLLANWLLNTAADGSAA